MQTKQLLQWQEKLIALHDKRKQLKSARSKRSTLTALERKNIYKKTNGRCHICGVKVSPDTFQADHVVVHVREGKHSVDNYLPACKLCNNYRWHYLPEELQIILKIGVWARSEMEKGTTVGKAMSEKYVAKEIKRSQRVK